MHTLARSPVCEARLNRQAGNRAFTLIELLTVIAIIAILAAITFGVVKGVNERAAISQAKAELASLSQALEAYKLQYGDYPQVNVGNWGALSTNETKLLQALIGKRGPSGAAIDRKNFLEISRFSLSIPNGNPATTTTITLQDPWGRDYLYYYYTAGAAPNIKRRGYVLFSRGPDNLFVGPDVDGPTGGDIKSATASNLDNIYAN